MEKKFPVEVFFKGDFFVVAIKEELSTSLYDSV